MSTVREIVEALRHRQSGAARQADQALLETVEAGGSPDEVNGKIVEAVRHSATERAFAESIFVILLDSHESRTKGAK